MFTTKSVKDKGLAGRLVMESAIFGGKLGSKTARKVCSYVVVVFFGWFSVSAHVANSHSFYRDGWEAAGESPHDPLGGGSAYSLSSSFPHPMK